MLSNSYSPETMAPDALGESLMHRTKKLIGSRLMGTSKAEVVEVAPRWKAKAARTSPPTKPERQKSGGGIRNLSPDDLVSFTTALETSLRFAGLGVEDAEDMAQEAMLVGIQLNEAVTYPRAWLRLVAKRFAAKRKRKERCQEKYFGKPVNLDNLLLSVDPVSELEQAEIRDALRDAVNGLPTDLQRVLIHQMAGLSNIDAAEVIGCSRNTVAIRLERAKELLRAGKVLQELL